MKTEDAHRILSDHVAGRRNAVGDHWGISMVGDAYDTLRQQLASVEAQRDRAVKDAERVREWVCHNGGLLNEWAAEWKPGRETCTAYIRRRLDAAITEEKQK